MFWQVIVVAAMLIPITAIVLDSQFGKALARRMERPKLKAGEETGHERFLALETEVERLGKEVERLNEENQFYQRLLAERPRDEGSGS